jgi:malate synthase
VSLEVILKQQTKEEILWKCEASLLEEFRDIVTPEALKFVVGLQRKFADQRKNLLARRVEVQNKINQGKFPNFLSETKNVREASWKVASIPRDLEDRRVEITGPVDRKMIINALNSGAQVFMADFEDSHSPTLRGTLEGQRNLKDAVRGQIQFKSPEGKEYKLNPKIATLMVRPRGWHLFEKNLLVDGQPVSGGIFDFGLFFFHNAKALIEKGSGPYFYLPKMESHLEARLWNEIFVEAQNVLGIPQGTIRATVLIETILASFEMEEILFELKDHSAGLNCGRWDYIFSFIKKFHKFPNFMLPDRALVTMNVHFLKSYCQLLIQTCHKRGAHAMGGMAAQIPIKNDTTANEAAMQKVKADKEREVNLGHDGTWVAHPGLVPLARAAFDAVMKTPNQISLKKEEVHITANDLLKVPEGVITREGLRMNINVGLLYLESWLRGTGCVPLYNLMEDAATAEISRAQVWQWVKHGKFSREDFKQILKEEMAGKTSESFVLAAKIFENIVCNEEFTEFLTSAAYQYI